MNGFKIWVQYFDKKAPFRRDGFIKNNNGVVIYKTQSECERVIMANRDIEKANKADLSEIPNYIIFDESYEGDYWHTVKLTGDHKDIEFDQIKSNKATQFIGIGSPNQKTYQYAQDWKRRANTGIYHDYDIIYVSIDNSGKEAITIDNPILIDLLERAIEAHATIVTDRADLREIAKNNGECDLAFYLKNKGYSEDEGLGVWKKATPNYNDEQLDSADAKVADVSTSTKSQQKKKK